MKLLPVSSRARSMFSLILGVIVGYVLGGVKPNNSSSVQAPPSVLNTQSEGGPAVGNNNHAVPIENTKSSSVQYPSDAEDIQEIWERKPGGIMMTEAFNSGGILSKDICEVFHISEDKKREIEKYFTTYLENLSSLEKSHLKLHIDDNGNETYEISSFNPERKKLLSSFQNEIKKIAGSDAASFIIGIGLYNDDNRYFTSGTNSVRIYIEDNAQAAAEHGFFVTETLDSNGRVTGTHKSSFYDGFLDKIRKRYGKIFDN